MNKIEQTFFKIPYALMTDSRYSGLSNDAKLLYGVLLNRAKQVSAKYDVLMAGVIALFPAVKMNLKQNK